MRPPGLWNYPRAVRTYTCSVDGLAITKNFYHKPGLGADALSRDLNDQFESWLETIACGARREGRVKHIQFSDGSEGEPGVAETCVTLSPREKRPENRTAPAAARHEPAA